MKRKLSTILAVLMIALLTFSTADAGGGIKLSAGFKLGSLIADGFLRGTGEETVTVVLTATGTCNNEQVSAIGTQVLPEDEETESDTRQFHVETNNPGDCSNDTESQNGFVFWTKASISVFSGDICGEFCEGLLSSAVQASNTLLVQQDYNCTTNFDAHTVSCTPVKKKGSNNGTTAICHATGNKKNPYVLLTVNANGLNGHGKHTGDIIPAPADGCPK
jgi:hypothetical protein